LDTLFSEEAMRSKLTCALAAMLLLGTVTTRLHAQTAADSAAIRATALDYIDGWYTNNAARMERALHPKLAKRMVWADSTGRSHLVDLTALELIQGTRGHPPVPQAERRKDVQILSTFGNAAVVRIDAADWVDYLQQIKWNGSWKIINVVWEDRPEKQTLSGKR
jgi:Putative lumazine-binding